jgi:hypothetical protein
MSDVFDSEDDEREYEACVGFLMRALLCSDSHVDDDDEIANTRTQHRATLH